MASALLTLIAASLVAKCVNTQDNPPRYSPLNWCDDRELAKAAGVEKACDDYNKNVFNKKVNLTLLYEFFCPGCRETITEVFPPLYAKYKSFVHFEFVPYGNYDRQTGIVCQEGDVNCYLHHVESCGVHFLDGEDQDKLVEFIVCLESQPEYAGLDADLATCFMAVPLNDTEKQLISECWNSELGNKLEEAMANRTEFLWPKRPGGMPFLMINDWGTSANYLEPPTIEYAVEQLGFQLCFAYRGDKIPPVCPGGDGAWTYTDSPNQI